MTVPYQKHSETSKEAAKLYDGSVLRTLIVSAIESKGAMGATRDDIASMTRHPYLSTISARLIELERNGLIKNTKMSRKSKANRKAAVYVHPDFYDPLMGVRVTKGATDIEALKARNARLEAALRAIARPDNWLDADNMPMKWNGFVNPIEMAREALDV